MFFDAPDRTLYLLIPTGAALLGGFLAYILRLGPLWMKFLFHLAAGILIAAVSVELVPRMLHTGEPTHVSLGFLAGAVAMILLKMLFSKLESFSTFSRVIASGLDFLIYGILIALAFYTSPQSGIVIASSLSVSAFLLNFSVATILQQKEWESPMQLITFILLAMMLPLGMWLGNDLLVTIHYFVKLEIIAFGTGALLYLGAEELLNRSHGGRENGLISSGFFLGFVLILLFY